MGAPEIPHTQLENDMNKYRILLVGEQELRVLEFVSGDFHEFELFWDTASPDWMIDKLVIAPNAKHIHRFDKLGWSQE